VKVAGDDDTEQVAASREAIAAVQSFLGGPRPDGDDWVFDFGEHVESNWGAVYGGALAAGTISIARSLVPAQSPRSLHLQITRSVPVGVAYATAEVRHAGRTVGTVEVDLFDARRKLAAVALITMVNPDAVPAGLHDTTATPQFNIEVRPQPTEYANLGAAAPVIETLDLLAKRDGAPVMLVADNVRPSVDGSPAFIGDCTVPWDNLDVTGPEAACLTADARIGTAIMRSAVPIEAVGPNADLSLRFTTAPATRIIQAASTMLSLQHGTATVGLELHAGDQQLAHGLATALLRRPE
jgi:acyl-coenzyme A thioesterase PaaI-like protein